MTIVSLITIRGRGGGGGAVLLTFLTRRLVEFEITGLTSAGFVPANEEVSLALRIDVTGVSQNPLATFIGTSSYVR